MWQVAIDFFRKLYRPFTGDSPPLQSNYVTGGDYISAFFNDNIQSNTDKEKCFFFFLIQTTPALPITNTKRCSIEAIHEK